MHSYHPIIENILHEASNLESVQVVDPTLAGTGRVFAFSQNVQHDKSNTGMIPEELQ